MARLLLLALIGIAAWLLLKKLIAANQAQDQSQPPPEAQAMKRCAQCGVYLPESEALAKDGRHFCCADHRDNFKG